MGQVVDIFSKKDEEGEERELTPAELVEWYDIIRGCKDHIPYLDREHLEMLCKSAITFSELIVAEWSQEGDNK